MTDGELREAVIFTSEGVALSGTFTVPQAVGRAPAVLMLPGSGQTDRDDNAKRLAINAFRPLARVLGERGFATFRYDKRGVGASEGDYWATGFDDQLTDAVAAVGWLASRSEVDPLRIFVLGHSEGALICVRLAAGGAPVAGIVLLAGSAMTGEQILLWQGRQIASTLKGFNKWLVSALHIDLVRSQQKNLDRLKAASGDVARIKFQKVNAKWMREFRGYDPAPDLAEVRVPVLAITGSKDIQVDPGDLERMAELIPGDFEAHVVLGVTHLLRIDPDDSGLQGYKSQARQPVDARIVEHVCDWLKRKANGKAG